MPELWQDDVRADRIADMVVPMLTDTARHDALQKAMAEVRSTMGPEGAVQRIAETILEFAKEKHIE